ncbi:MULTISPECIES: hypothetical protein [Lysinibacillus]|uniref:Orn/DAP/Arg decarboxylase 2 N-terminal domain-containing protein n=1 Tax=Lysinibacillus sphaericus TaxID=1421 RepID=A0A544ULM3_LYSSH|nr:hypothetical protein [Lysinibacillus sp. SDF0037]TQR34377.1 hypothetical protein C7Y47_10425 [Lysinibacillus sp. SDF0037]
MNKSIGKILEPLYSQPPKELFEIIKTISTPALIYDFNGMGDVIERIKEDISVVPNTKLNLAVKATHTPKILEIYAESGLGCDVASIGEYKLAKNAGFKEITTTGPAFSENDMDFFYEENVIIDLDSISQIELYGYRHPNTDIGLRIRIPLPKELESNSTYGKDSRFGLNISNPELKPILKKYNLNITRLHVHTGQMTPDSLLYKANYLLAIAEQYENIHTIDFGGGFFHLYINRNKTKEVFYKLRDIVNNWRRKTGREMEFRFEPGGALLSGCGYLITKIMAKEYHDFFNVNLLTLDSSAWNLAPWHKPQVIPIDSLNSDSDLVEYKLTGNTLYEGDIFGRDTNGNTMKFHLPIDIKVGEKLMMCAFGAYTITNSRQFNKIPLPIEYLLKDGKLIKIEEVKNEGN